MDSIAIDNYYKFDYDSFGFVVFKVTGKLEDKYLVTTLCSTLPNHLYDFDNNRYISEHSIMRNNSDLISESEAIEWELLYG